MADLALLVEIEATAKQLLVEVSRARQALDPGVTGSADRAQAELDGVGTAGEGGGRRAADGMKAAGQAAGQAAALASELKRELGGLLTLDVMRRVVTSAVESARQLEMTFKGLESTANFTGVGIAAAWAKATALSADGLMTVQQSAASLQQLLLRGYSLDQAVQVIERLKDAAAFGRAAHLDLGEAVKTAAEGLKQENSVLVDNAGVTKNVSVMWKEYADSIGTSAEKLTQGQKVTAEFQGILRETAPQLGDAAKAAGGLEGEIAKLNKAVNDAQAAFGASLFPAVQTLAGAGASLMNGFVNPLLAGVEKAGIYAGAMTTRLGLLYDAVKSWDFSNLNAALNRNVQETAAAVKEVEDRYKAGVTPAIQAATAATGQHTAAAKGTRAAVADVAAAAAAMKDQAKAAHDAAAAAARNTIQVHERLSRALAAAKEEFGGYGKIKAPVPEKPAFLDVGIEQSKAARALADKDYQGALEQSRRAGEFLNQYVQTIDQSSELARAEVAGLREQIAATAIEAQKALNSEVLKSEGIQEVKIQANKAALVASVQEALASLGTLIIPVDLVPRTRVRPGEGAGIYDPLGDAAQAAGGRP